MTCRVGDGDPCGICALRRDEPLVGAHAHRAVRFELLGQGGPSGARQPAQQDQVAAHGRGLQIVTP
jgi:hypothetical protein